MNQLPTLSIGALALALAGWTAADVEPAAAPATPPAPTAAEVVFERFKSMEGRWAGESTMGWKDVVEFSVIARGSVVMAVSEFEAHPGETMVTMYHMDGEHLVLTHYCVAGNQPHLRATAFEEEGRAIRFTWADGTGLESRDEGHMDQALIRFGEDGSYTSRWTWYEDGAESWMEDIRLERIE